MANNINQNPIWIEDLGNRKLEFHCSKKTLIFNELDFGVSTLLSKNELDRERIIKELIRMKWSEGILYLANTIEECNDMLNWVEKNLVGRRSQIAPHRLLKSEDVLICHSEDLLECNLNKIPDKRIVICTFDKITSNSIMYLLDGQFVKSIGMFRSEDIVIRGLTDTLPRQWILIDELPRNISFGFLKSSLNILKDNHNLTAKAILFLSKLGLKLEESRDILKKEMSDDNWYINSDSFRIAGIDNIFYPKKYEDLFSSYSDEDKYSRRFHLNHRSTQEKLMDLLVRINYFGVTIHREVPFITDKSYYLADYYIPDRNLVIELDSNLHIKINDQIRDEYFKTLGIRVERFMNFTANDLELKKMSELIYSIKPSSPRIYRFDKLGKLKDVLHINDGYNSCIFRKLLKRCVTSETDRGIEFDKLARYKFDIIKLKL